MFGSEVNAEVLAALYWNLYDVNCTSLAGPHTSGNGESHSTYSRHVMSSSHSEISTRLATHATSKARN